MNSNTDSYRQTIKIDLPREYFSKYILDRYGSIYLFHIWLAFDDSIHMHPTRIDFPHSSLKNDNEKKEETRINSKIVSQKLPVQCTNPSNQNNMTWTTTKNMKEGEQPAPTSALH